MAIATPIPVNTNPDTLTELFEFSPSRPESWLGLCGATEYGDHNCIC